MPATAKQPRRLPRRAAPSRNGAAMAKAGLSIRKYPIERAELFEHYAICRAEGHEWKHLGLGNNLRAAPRFGDCYPFVSRCQNCGTERTKWFTRSGHSAGTEYRYSEHYQQHGEGKLERDDWGKLFIRSHLGTA